MKKLILFLFTILIWFAGTAQTTFKKGIKVGNDRVGTSIIVLDSITQRGTGEVIFWKGAQQLNPNLILGFKIGTTAVTSSAVELNKLTGFLGSTLELNRAVVGMKSTMQTQADSIKTALNTLTTAKLTNWAAATSAFVTGTPWTSMGYLTSYTETDPTISSWAKASIKPTYSASEIGLGNVTNESKATMFTNPTFTTGITTPLITLGVTAITPTAAELNYTDGVTSPIQTQLNNKVNIADSVAGYTAGEVDSLIVAKTDSMIQRLFTGYTIGLYRYKVQRDSVALPTTLVNDLAFIYEMDETSGTVATDGKGINGTVTGTVTVNQTGISGKAYTFGGGYVTVPHNVVQNLTSGDIITKAFTYSMWVYTTANTEGILYRKRFGSEFQINNANGELRLIPVSAVVVSGSLTTGGAIPLNVWTNIIISGSNGNIKYYINNVLTNTVSITRSVSAATDVMNFGESFTGSMDQVAGWSRELTSDERALIYGGGSAKPYSSW